MDAIKRGVACAHWRLGATLDPVLATLDIDNNLAMLEPQ